jgi:pyruvate dehydrogenase E1 component beta subunit
VVVATIRSATLETLFEEMSRDEDIFVIGEGARVKFSLDSPRFLEVFPDRIVTAPVCEGGIVGLALGAAISGLRPVVDLTFNDLSLRAMDEIVNHVSKIHYVSGGKVSARMVVKADFNRPENAHSGDRLEALFLHSPGLKVAVPSTPSDASGMMRAALRGEDPVLFYEDRIIDFTEEIHERDVRVVPFGKARVVMQGSDVTVASYGVTVHLAAKAVANLKSGRVELIDIRSLNPLDYGTILSSVRKTQRLVIVEPDHVRLGVGAEIAARVADVAYESLKAPITRVGVGNSLFPAATKLQAAILPSVPKIEKALKKTLEYHTKSRGSQDV